MVYIYTCKRFKTSMDMVQGREGDWVNKILESYCKHHKISGKLERAEINPKTFDNIPPFDSSKDVFKINLVYKNSASGREHELKWIITVSSSDQNDFLEDSLLRHEKMVYSRLLTDLINFVKVRGAGRLEGARVPHQELLRTPDFVFEETIHVSQTDVFRNVLILDNLEEQDFYPLLLSEPLTLSHMKTACVSLAKFHAVSLTYKKSLFASFNTARKTAYAERDEAELEDESQSTLTGKNGLFARFPFLSQGHFPLSYLLSNKETFFEMYAQFLRLFAEDEPHLIEIFEYITHSASEILENKSSPRTKYVNSNNHNNHNHNEEYNNNTNKVDEIDHPLDSIALGVLEPRSFLFRSLSDEKKQKPSTDVKVQRSQSERHKKNEKFKGLSLSNDSKKSLSFFKSKEYELVTPIISTKKTNKERKRNADDVPKSAAIVNIKYVHYDRVTKDLAVLFFTCGDTLIRQFYLMKCLECYIETLGLSLGQLGIDTDKMELSYTGVISDFQQHLLYGFIIGVLVAMANTSPYDLKIQLHSSDFRHSESCITLSAERIKFILDLMRDIAAYVESKDFELGLLVTNFGRYHELWSMCDPEDE